MPNLAGDVAQRIVFDPENKFWEKSQKTGKIRYQIFVALSNFALFLYFVSNILSWTVILLKK